MGRMVAKSGSSGRGGQSGIERVEAPAGSEDATLMMARVSNIKGKPPIWCLAHSWRQVTQRKIRF